MGEAIDKVVNIERVMNNAHCTDLRTIAAIIPYLEGRQLAAKKYYQMCNSSLSAIEKEKQKEVIFELVQNLNKSMADILGLID